MAKGITWKIEIPDLNRFKRKLKPAEALYGDPWREAMQGLAADLGQRAKAAAPVRTGVLRASITATAAKTRVPLSLRVRVRARSARGFPYPKVLEFSPSHHHLRWLRNVVQSAAAMISKRLDTAARAIEGDWAKY